MSGASSIVDRGIGAWRRFWFASIPPHLYAALRIAFGLCGVLQVLGEAHQPDFWWPGGYERVEATAFKAFLVERGLGPVAGTTIFVGSLLSAVAMTVGYRAPLAVPLVFGFTLLHVSWNDLPLSSAMQVYRAFVFCLIWVDTGDVWSVDRWLARRAGRRSAQVEPEPQPIWPLRLMRVQLALVYLNTAWWKLFNISWRDGSALYWVMSGNEFRRLPSMPRPELDWVWTLGTYLTIGWELLFVVLLFHPLTRSLALIFGVMAHLSMWLLLELAAFSLVMLSAYLAFLDPDRFRNKFQSRQSIA